MLDEKDLQAIANLLEPINKRLDTMQSDIDELKESAEITREAVNKILDWTDEVTKVNDFPLPKVQ